jgi:hypothetical protein
LVSTITNVEIFVGVGLIIITLVWIVSSMKSNAPPVTYAPVTAAPIQATLPNGGGSGRR